MLDSSSGTATKRSLNIEIVDPNPVVKIKDHPNRKDLEIHTLVNGHQLVVPKGDQFVRQHGKHHRKTVRKALQVYDGPIISVKQAYDNDVRNHGRK